MTYQQLLHALDIDPSDPASDGVLYELPDTARSDIVGRLGNPQQAEVTAGGRLVLTYPIDGGGRALIVGFELAGMIKGLVFIDR
jgi:hypothetical protein